MRDPRIEELQKEVEQLRKEKAALAEENRLLRQKVEGLIRRIFGKKSEQLDPRQMELLLGDLSAKEEEPEVSPELLAAAAPKKPPRKARPRKPRYPEDLPVVTEVLDPDEVTGNPDAWRQIGEEVSEQLDYEPGRFLRRQLIRRVWVKRGDADGTPKLAVLPPKLLERGCLAPGLLAHIIVSKYADHLPLYRQEQIFAQRHDVHIPRQTMARGVELVAEWLKPVEACMIAEQLAAGYMQVDETPVAYLNPGQGRTGQGYFWTVNTPGGNTVYHWATSRGHEVLLEILPETFEGNLQCDGYSAYRALLKKRSGIILSGCWAHVRRKFVAAFEQGENRVRNAWVLHQMGMLYAIEQGLRESRAGPAEREAVRAWQSRPIVERLRKVIEMTQSKVLPRSLTGEAVQYALGQWDGLEVYLTDGRLEIDNNLVENAIRPTALGRKNWLFVGAAEAGWRSAVIYSILQSCKTYGVEPYAYLKDVLERLPSMTNHQVAQITPKAWAAARKIKPAIAS